MDRHVGGTTARSSPWLVSSLSIPDHYYAITLVMEKSDY